MKINLKKMLAGLFAGALLFTACKPTVGDDSGSGNGPDLTYAPVGNFEVAYTSVKMAENMAIGWNLGNALDASGTNDWAYNAAKSGELEYGWLPHKQKTSHNLIKAVKAAGFKTIRIPISWHNYMSKTDSNYKIYDSYLSRVKELVDWSLAEGMCVIINIHHDNLSEEDLKENPGFALTTDAELQEKSTAFITKVWAQIAETFKNYDNRLVFELLNEPRCVGTNVEWGFWGENASKASTYCDIITKYEQAALNVIRASGGNNTARYVMAPGYAASPDYLGSYKLPVDKVSDRLILAVHAYTPGDFCLDGGKSDYDSNKTYIEGAIDQVFNMLSNNYVKKGQGVVMGEASASDKDNLASREKWAKYYFAKSQAAGVPVMLWDNECAVAMGQEAGGENHGYFNRVTCKQTWPSMIKIMMEAVYGKDFAGNSSNGGNDDDPADEPEDSGDSVVLFEGSYDLEWSENKTFEAVKFANVTESSKLVFKTAVTEGKVDYVNIKLQAGDWSEENIFCEGTVTDGVISGDVIEVAATSTGFTYQPTASEWDKIKSVGLIVYGHGIKITKIELK